MTNNDVTYKPLIKSGIFLGVGLGGFFDGIVFHQLLQVHNMLSARFPKTSIPNIEVNMFWDGLFHVFCFLMVVIGIGILWRAGRREDVPWTGKTLAASTFLGWGIFNLAEGIVDHHILNVHHVVEALGVSWYDYAFLASGVIFIMGGWITIRGDQKRDLVFHPLPGPAHG